MYDNQGQPQGQPYAQPYTQPIGPTGQVASQVAPIRVRQQKGHSIIKHLFFGIFAAYIPTIYYAISKDHYFHL